MALERAIEGAQAGHRPAVDHRGPHHHRLARADKQNTGAAHGSALGEDEIRQTKEILGFDPDVHFAVDAAVLEHAREVVERGRDAHAAWQQQFDAWAAANAERAELLDRMSTPRAARRLGRHGCRTFPTEKDGKPNAISTRAASGKVLSALADVLPELWGGSADLAESNNTTMEGEPSFIPAAHQTKEWPGGPYGRTLHFGIREHAMGSIMNGITLHGGTRVYGGTFLVFSDYMRPPVRLAALMKLPTIYVWTHDSIGLGGDGPDPPADRAPGRAARDPRPGRRPPGRRQRDRRVLAGDPRAHRPPDRARPVAAEPAGARPGQGPPTPPRGRTSWRRPRAGLPKVILIATGSEVALALDARASGSRPRARRPGSCRCRAVEWFEAQPPAYRQQVLPPDIKARVSVEAGVGQGWREFVGDAGEIISIEHFGASADGGVLFEQFGFTPDRVVAAAHAALERAGEIRGATTGN